jgi:hypothetical protein
MAFNYEVMDKKPPTLNSGPLAAVLHDRKRFTLDRIPSRHPCRPSCSPPVGPRAWVTQSLSIESSSPLPANYYSQKS